MSKPVEVTQADQEAMGIERDYTRERDDRVRPFVQTLIKNLGTHEFVFAGGTRADVDELDRMIDRFSMAPTDTKRTPEEEKQVADSIAEMTEQRNAISEAIEKEKATFDTFYEQKFIGPVLDTEIRHNDLNYTFSLLNMATEMLKTQAVSPDRGTEFRLVPAAQEILCAMGEVDDLMLIVSEGEKPSKGLERTKLYEEMYRDVVVPIFDKHKVQYNEVLQVFGILQSLIQSVKQRSDVTVNGARAIADAKLWGLDDVDDLTVKAIHQMCIEKQPE